MPDRIAAGTFATAAVISGGATLKDVNIEHISSVVSKLQEGVVKLLDIIIA